MFAPHNLKRKMDEENNCYVKVEIEGKLSYCFLAWLCNVTAAKWPDCRMALLQYGLTAICLYCNMATAIWPTAIWRRQNDALPYPTPLLQPTTVPKHANRYEILVILQGCYIAEQLFSLTEIYIVTANITFPWKLTPLTFSLWCSERCILVWTLLFNQENWMWKWTKVKYIKIFLNHI